MLDGDLAWEGCARNSGVVKVIENICAEGAVRAQRVLRGHAEVFVFEADGFVHHV